MDFGNMKVPLKSFMDILRIPTNFEQKNVVFPLVSLVLKQRLNNEVIDTDSLTGHQNKFYNEHQQFFTQLVQLGDLPVAQRQFLGKVFSDVGDSLKAGRKPFIVGGESNALYAKDEPNSHEFTFSDTEKQKISQTRDFLNNSTDKPVYHEMLNTVPTGRIFGGKFTYVRYHLFVLEEKELTESKVSVNF